MEFNISFKDNNDGKEYMYMTISSPNGFIGIPIPRVGEKLFVRSTRYVVREIAYDYIKKGDIFTHVNIMVFITEDA